MRGHRMRPGIVLLTVAALGVASAGSAWAYWTSTASSSLSAAAATLQPPATVTATSASLTSIDVTVTGAPATGPAPAAYRVSRGATVICSSVALNTVCSDTGLTPNTQYTYTVTSRLGTDWTSTGTTKVASTSAVPAPSVPALTAATDSGAAGDGFTSSTTPAFTGTATPNSVVTLVIDGTAVTPTATANAGGTWTITPTTAPSANVAHQVKARATFSGSTSVDSAALSLLIDTVAPTMGTATSACSVALTNTWCRGTTTITVPSLSDAAPASGLAGLTYSITGGASGTAPVTNGSASVSFTAPDGSPAVTYAVRDVAGNQAATGSITPTKMDNTAPQVASLSLNNGTGGTVGKPEAGDTVTIGFTDAASGFDPKTICSNWTTASTPTANTPGDVTVTITDAGASDTLSVAVNSSTCGTFALGTIALNADLVSSTTTFGSNGNGNGSSLAYSAGTVTVTFGKVGPNNGGARTVAANATPSFTPVSTLKDVAGNAIATTAVAGTPSRF